tara:strand:- start:989 stop:1189 length:201 start_codon:yes stop_codon:yes gene_type:complete
MNIMLNNEDSEVRDGMTIAQLLNDREIQNKYIAVEVNKIIIPKSDYQKYEIKNGDRIEIITAIGGG